MPTRANVFIQQREQIHRDIQRLVRNVLEQQSGFNTPLGPKSAPILLTIDATTGDPHMAGLLDITPMDTGDGFRLA